MQRATPPPCTLTRLIVTHVASRAIRWRPLSESCCAQLWLRPAMAMACHGQSETKFESQAPDSRLMALGAAAAEDCTACNLELRSALELSWGRGVSSGHRGRERCQGRITITQPGNVAGKGARRLMCRRFVSFMLAVGVAFAQPSSPGPSPTASQTMGSIAAPAMAPGVCFLFVIQPNRRQSSAGITAAPTWGSRPWTLGQDLPTRVVVPVVPDNLAEDPSGPTRRSDSQKRGEKSPSIREVLQPLQPLGSLGTRLDGQKMWAPFSR